MQIIADVTGRPVFTIAEDVEASLGAAMLAALGVGLIDEATVRRGWVQPVPRALPQPAAHRAYTALFAHYQAAYPALKPLMHGLRQLPAPA
jgi:xylulokinase